MDERDLAILEDEHKGKLEDRWLYKELTPAEEIRLERIREAKIGLRGLGKAPGSTAKISLDYICDLEGLLAKYKEALEIASHDGMQYLAPKIGGLLDEYRKVVHHD